MSSEERQKRRLGLGRGLDALFGEAEPVAVTPAAGDAAPAAGPVSPRSLPVGQLEPGPFQPRRSFDEAELDRLSESIRTQGVLQPILVRPIPDQPDRFHIIAGERRWRAAQRARLHEVPVVIREMTDGEALQIAIIENVQRQDLTALEEAQGYRRLLTEFGLTQEDVARAVGKSRSHVANTIRLLDLPEPVLDMLQSGAITAGHARALLGSADPIGVARQIVRKALSVRQAETLARNAGSPSPVGRPGGGAALPGEKDPDTLALERRLEMAAGVRAQIYTRPDGSGTLTFHFADFVQLDEIIERVDRPLER